MAPTLDHAETILSNVGVLWSEGDEPLFGEPHCIAVIVVAVDLGIGYVGRPALEPVLAYHDGTPLPGGNILRHEENALGEDAGPNIEHHLVSAIFWLIED